MRRIGDAAMKQGDLIAARQQYEACLAIRQRLSAANPSSAQLKSAVALDYFDLGALAFEQKDLAAARQSYSQSLAIRRALAAADPTDFVQQQLILQAMTRLAQLQGGITWEQVRDQYKSIKDGGHLVANDEKVLSALRTHGLADGL
jgi:tetratricopeptide (TPR) repeat protein